MNIYIRAVQLCILDNYNSKFGNYLVGICMCSISLPNLFKYLPQIYAIFHENIFNKRIVCEQDLFLVLHSLRSLESLGGTLQFLVQNFTDKIQYFIKVLRAYLMNVIKGSLTKF